MKFTRILAIALAAGLASTVAFAEDAATDTQTPAAQTQTTDSAATTSTDAAKTDMVNINTADAKTIAKELSGTGKRRAEAIVDYREKNGQFKSVDDLMNVKGITKRWMEKHRDKITVG